MNTEHLTEALTTATKALTEAECCCDRGDAISDLAKALAQNDTFVAALLGHLGSDLDRATRIAWQDGYQLAKELARQDRALA
jgi:hypothetical protein